MGTRNEPQPGRAELPHPRPVQPLPRPIWVGPVSVRTCEKEVLIRCAGSPGQYTLDRFEFIPTFDERGMELELYQPREGGKDYYRILLTTLGREAFPASLTPAPLGGTTEPQQTPLEEPMGFTFQDTLSRSWAAARKPIAWAVIVLFLSAFAVAVLVVLVMVSYLLWLWLLVAIGGTAVALAVRWAIETV